MYSTATFVLKPLAVSPVQKPPGPAKQSTCVYFVFFIIFLLFIALGVDADFGSFGGDEDFAHV